MKEIPFSRSASSEEIKELINEMFSEFSDDFIFLEGQKNNSLSVASEQYLDGPGVIELARHGSLYLTECTTSAKPNPTESPTPATPSLLGLSEVSNSAAEPVSVKESPPEAASTSHLSKENKVLFAKADDVLEKLKVNYCLCCLVLMLSSTTSVLKIGSGNHIRLNFTTIEGVCPE